jgi:hypothetical protein
MKLTIIPLDGAVYKDGFSYSGLDLPTTPENVHALQWDNGAGWIEFKNESEFCKPANQAINTLPTWADAALTKWEEAKAAEEAAIAAAIAAAEVLTQNQE